MSCPAHNTVEHARRVSAPGATVRISTAALPRPATRNPYERSMRIDRLLHRHCLEFAITRRHARTHTHAHTRTPQNLSRLQHPHPSTTSPKRAVKRAHTASAQSSALIPPGRAESTPSRRGLPSQQKPPTAVQARPCPGPVQPRPRPDPPSGGWGGVHGVGRRGLWRLSTARGFRARLAGCPQRQRARTCGRRPCRTCSGTRPSGGGARGGRRRGAPSRRGCRR